MLEAPVTRDRRIPLILTALEKQPGERWDLDGWDLVLHLPSATLRLKHDPSGLTILHVVKTGNQDPSVVVYSTEYPQLEAVREKAERCRKQAAAARSQVLDSLLAELEGL